MSQDAQRQTTGRKPRSAAFSEAKNKKSKKRIVKWIAWIVAALAAIYMIFSVGMLWFASGQLLGPSFHGVTRDLSVCKPETAKAYGKDCGNLRTTHEFAFSEIKIPSVNGYDLPGWYIKAADNGKPAPKGAIMLVHAGGSDRREDTRYINFYLSQGLDVVTFDFSCQGEAPCLTGGLSYGDHESRDVFSVYKYLSNTYSKVYAMGSSVGAAAILVALPEMPQLAGAVIENPYTSFEALVKDAKEAKGMPESAVKQLVDVTEMRGHFDGQASPEHALPLAGKVPLLFVHSQKDSHTPYHQTETLAALYTGPKTVWYPAYGDHAAIWDANHADYEKHVADFLASIN